MGGAQLGRSAGSGMRVSSWQRGYSGPLNRKLSGWKQRCLVMEAHAGVSHSADDACGGRVLGLTIALETGDIAHFASVGDYAS